ncbi:TIGR01906 family membrane protein [Lutispora thermophila]|uniref:Integral membrane protein TIGR01906 n=1 Tax=Lutispora thermophila DSM 19022 TaxID=1122184 RepID=A0A1M6EXJ5_9FIRM|nr:TIGR01906 family membrane protein [Lutispora thermophila]SHI90109.1 integral membrane protein TIGR01906 [Lutispora thermophila DSM 19022]
MTEKLFKNVFYIIISLILSLLLLLTATEIVVFDMDYYKNQYKKNNIPATVGVEEKDLMESTEKLLDYLKDKRGNLDFKTKINGEEKEFFSERDKLHMIDVKHLFVAGRKIRNGIFIFFLILAAFFISKKIRCDFGKYFLVSSIVGIMPFGILVILMKIDFYKYFTMFHEIFFSNDLWLLDPKVDRLANIFPEIFFYDTAIKIIIYYLTVQFVLFILGLIIMLKKRKL